MGKPAMASESAIIDAAAQDIYRVLADYVTEHPRIVPRPFFQELVVESGGRGAGTVYRTVTQVWGRRQSFRMTVSEPEPGRVLREEDPVAGVVTTFRLTPLSETRTEVEIATEWAGQGGLRGWLERLFVPRTLRPIYRQELALIGKYLAH
jgi:hypothetical protein